MIWEPKRSTSYRRLKTSHNANYNDFPMMIRRLLLQVLHEVKSARKARLWEQCNARDITVVVMKMGSVSLQRFLLAYGETEGEAVTASASTSEGSVAVERPLIGTAAGVVGHEYRLRPHSEAPTEAHTRMHTRTRTVKPKPTSKLKPHLQTGRRRSMAAPGVQRPPRPGN